MKKIVIEVFIGDIKEDQLVLEKESIPEIEELRAIKRKYNNMISNRIKDGDWREPNFAGEYAVSLKLISNDFSKDQINELEKFANIIF